MRIALSTTTSRLVQYIAIPPGSIPTSVYYKKKLYIVAQYSGNPAMLFVYTVWQLGQADY